MTNKKFCKKYGYTMSDLSRISGVPRITLYDMDYGFNVNPDTVKKVMTARKEMKPEPSPWILPVIALIVYLCIIVVALLVLL